MKYKLMYLYNFVKLTTHVIKVYLGFSFTIQNVDKAVTKKTPYMMSMTN